MILAIIRIIFISSSYLGKERILEDIVSLVGLPLPAFLQVSQDIVERVVLQASTIQDFIGN